ncbi:hypothetical protein PENTCL1PPCAC_13960, partial [Pristionchus entomophagus]
CFTGSMDYGKSKNRRRSMRTLEKYFDQQKPSRSKRSEKFVNVKQERQRRREERKRQENQRSREKKVQERLISEEERRQVEELTKAIEKLRTDVLYLQLDAKAKELEDIKAQSYKKQEPATPAVGDPGMLEEVFVRGRTETSADWDAQAANQGEDGECLVDYIICSEPREIGEDPFTVKLLVKWEGYPTPTWEDSSSFAGNGNASDEFSLLQRWYDHVELYIRRIKTDAYFEKHFPNRYLKRKTGEGTGGYISNERGLYKNRLKAIERHFNAINRAWGLAPVFIEDWTKLDEVDEALRNLIYIHKRILAAGVSELLQKHQNGLNHMKCSGKCGECKRHDYKLMMKSKNGGEPKRAKNTHAVEHCCGHIEALVLTEDGPPELYKGQKVDASTFCRMRVECTDDCGCDEDTCANRVVQNGRQHPLLIFRDPVKGWTIRCLTEIDVHEVVSDYAGVMQLENSTDEIALTYDFSLTYPIDREDGMEENGKKGSTEIRQGEDGDGADGKEKSRPLFICAYEQGNESRFFSHSCSPNMHSENTIIKRDGLHANDIAFFPIRNLTRGEELTFDYFDGRPLNEETDVQHFEYCSCESPACRYTKKKVTAFLRWYRRKYGDIVSGEPEKRSLEMNENMLSNPVKRCLTTSEIGEADTGETSPSSCSGNSDPNENDVIKKRRVSRGESGSTLDGCIAPSATISSRAHSEESDFPKIVAEDPESQETANCHKGYGEDLNEDDALISDTDEMGHRKLRWAEAMKRYTIDTLCEGGYIEK